MGGAWNAWEVPKYCCKSALKSPVTECLIIFIINRVYDFFLTTAVAQKDKKQVVTESLSKGDPVVLL